jgi:hypothetical protein
VVDSLVPSQLNHQEHPDLAHQVRDLDPLQQLHHQVSVPLQEDLARHLDLEGNNQPLDNSHSRTLAALVPADSTRSPRHLAPLLVVRQVQLVEVVSSEQPRILVKLPHLDSLKSLLASLELKVNNHRMPLEAVGLSANNLSRHKETQEGSEARCRKDSHRQQLDGCLTLIHRITSNRLTQSKFHTRSAQSKS